MTRLPTRLLLLLLVLPATAPGCGGGGGGGPVGSVTLLDGDYFLAAVGAFDTVPSDQGQSLWGVVVPDGAGTMTGTYGSNLATSVSGPTPLPGGTTYAVAPDLETSLVFAGTSPYGGWTDAAGALVLTGSTGPGDQPATLAMVRLGSGFDDTSLSGDYRFCGWGVNDTGDAFSVSGLANLDGTGSGSADFTENIEGSVASTGMPLPVTYAVAPNGQATMDLAGLTLECAVFRGGDAILACGSTTDTDVPIMMAFVRTTTGTSNDTFRGTYTLVGMERDGSGFTSLVGSVVPDGAGSLTATFTRNEDGTFVPSGPDIVPYSVNATGGLQIDPTSGTEPVGGITGDGGFAILGGPVAAGTSPKMFLLLRR